MVKLPSYEWFMGLISFRGDGNTYSGSFGCDPAKGITDGNIFRYVVTIDKQEDTMVLKALYYVGVNALGATDKSLITEKLFECSPEGVLLAQQWIQDAADEFYKNK